MKTSWRFESSLPDFEQNREGSNRYIEKICSSMNCENCRNSHDGSYGSGRFCSAKCSRSFSTKNKRKEINERVSKSLRGSVSPKKGLKIVPRKVKKCLECNCEFETIREDRRFCSKSCGAKSLAKKRLQNGTHNGFPSRKDKNPSWAEKTVMKIFEEKGISFQRDFKINRFFGDFVFIDKKLVLEIDGKQHLERKQYDKARDEIIRKEGYEVVRISWVHRNFEEMKERIEKFLQEYF